MAAGDMSQAEFLRDPATNRIVGFKYYGEVVELSPADKQLSADEVTGLEALLTGRPPTTVDDITLFNPALSGFVGGEVVYARGRSAVGDGGGGTFLYYATSMGTDNGVTIFASGRLIRVYTGLINPAWAGCKGDWNGVTGTDDTVALQLALNAGKILLAPKRSYKFTARLTVPSYGGIESDGTGRLFATAAGFNNTTQATQFTANSCCLDISGATSGGFAPSVGVSLKSFILESEVSPNRRVDAISARNCKNPSIEKVEIVGFPLGCGIKADSWDGGQILEPNIHDFGTTSDFWASIPQVTGIEFDNNRVNSISSKGVKIRGGSIINMTNTVGSIPGNNYQTDGINLQAGSGFDVDGVEIRLVDEGIDCFATDSKIRGNRLEEVRAIGIKIIHGASRDTVSGNHIKKFGLAGILVFGSAVVGAVDQNIVSGNILTEGDYQSVWGGSTSTACIKLADVGGAFQPTNTQVFGNTCTPGPLCQYGIIRGDHGSGNQIGPNIVKAGSIARYFEGLDSSDGTKGFLDARPTRFLAQPSGDTVVLAATATETDILCANVISDTRGEVSGGTWVCQVDGYYDVEAVQWVSEMQAGINYWVRARAGATLVSLTHHKPTGASLGTLQTRRTGYYFTRGTVVKMTFQKDVTTNNATISNNTGLSYLSVVAR